MTRGPRVKKNKRANLTSIDVITSLLPHNVMTSNIQCPGKENEYFLKAIISPSNCFGAQSMFGKVYYEIEHRFCSVVFYIWSFLQFQIAVVVLDFLSMA